MTTQEKINQLADAALKEAPKAPTVQPVANVRVPAGHASTLVAGESVDPSTLAASNATTVEIGSDLRQMIDTRELRMKKKRTRISLALTCTFLAAVASGAGWVAFSTNGNQSWTALSAAIRESKGDLKSLTGILGNYDKQLQKIAVQSARVDAATRALGVDPASEANQGAGELNDEMKKMQATGGGAQGGPTSLDRNQALQQKFGVISKLAGRDPEKAKAAAESDVKF